TLLRSLQTLVLCAATLPIALFCAHTLVRGETDARASPDHEPISVSATFAQSWKQERETVHILRGQCQIVQGTTTIHAERMVIWRRTESGPARERLTLYLEDGVRIDEPGNSLVESTLVLDLATDAGVTIDTKKPAISQEGTNDPTYQRGAARRSKSRNSAVRKVQYIPSDADLEPELRSIQLPTPPGGIRRVRAFPRSGVEFYVDSRRSELTTPPEQIVVLSGGINLLIDGPGSDPAAPPGTPGRVGTIDLSADRVVIWT